MGFGGRDRGLSQQRRPQGDRAAHARTERGEGGGQALRARAIAPKRGRSSLGSAAGATLGRSRANARSLPSPKFGASSVRVWGGLTPVLGKVGV